MNFSKRFGAVLLAAALAALFFALGLLYADRMRGPSPQAPGSALPSSPMPPASREPKILIGPNSIELLPDASLRLAPIATPSASAAGSEYH